MLFFLLFLLLFFFVFLSLFLFLLNLILLPLLFFFLLIFILLLLLLLLLQRDLGAEEHLLECDPSTGVCLLLYDSAPSGRFGSMTYLTKAVAAYVQDFLPAGACAVQ